MFRLSPSVLMTTGLTDTVSVGQADGTIKKVNYPHLFTVPDVLCFTNLTL